MTLAHTGHVVAAVPAGTLLLRVLLLVAAVVLAGTAVASRRWWALPLLSVPVLLATVGASGWLAVAVGAHVAAASLWVGAVVHVVWTRRRVALTPLAVSAASTVALTGLVLSVANRVRLDAVLFDRLVLLKAALLVAAALLGARRLRVELVPLVAAAAIGAALIAVPTAPRVGVPLVAGDLTVVPQRPGPNLVHVATDEPLLVNGVASHALPGATGQWVSLDLPAGRSTLRVGDRTAVVDTGHSAPLEVSGPECASALLAGATACPDQRLEPSDATALDQLTTWLHGRGALIQVVGDDTPRSQQVRIPTSPNPTAIVLTGGWASAAEALRRIGRTAPRDGVYLAPWLLNGPLLASYAVAAPYAVLAFDPHAKEARQYVAQLAQGESPSVAGYRAWGGPASTVQLWATTPASIFPKDLRHEHASGGWFPGGALVPVADLHPDGSRELVIRAPMTWS